MSKAIYLHKQHENFQAHSTKLKTSAAYPIHIFLIIGGILISISLFGLGIYQLSSVWGMNEKNEREIRGRVIACENLSDSENSMVKVSYTYRLNGRNYPLDYYDSKWRCSHYPQGAVRLIYYQATMPEVAQFTPFHTEATRNQGVFLTLVAFGLLVCAIFMLKKEEGGRKKYQRLQELGKVVEARVTAVINKRKEVVTKKTQLKSEFGEISNIERQNVGFRQANYRFFTPDGQQREGRIRSDIHAPWPQNIREGDILHILYLDDTTFCVL
jgi:hypothetical protein